MLNLKETNLIRSQPLGAKSRGVDQEEKGSNTKENGGDALKQEDPAPALVATHTVHLGDCSGQETGERTRERGCAVEAGNADSQVSWHVPKGNKVHRGGEEACFEYSEEDADGQETSKVLDDTVEGHDDSPDCDEGAEVDGRALELLQEDVARHLCETPVIESSFVILTGCLSLPRRM